MSFRCLVALSLVACYGAAPPPPAKIPLPPIAAGATIDVESHDVTTVEQVSKTAKSCNEATPDPQHCTTTSYTEAEPVTRTHTSASYGSAPLSYAQLKVLSDEHYDEKVQQLAELSHVCRRANVPRYLGLIGIIGGAIVIGEGQNHDSSVVTGAGIAAIAGGIASYAAGYYAFGGRECTQARSLYNEIDYGGQQWTDVVGEGYAQEMKDLAARFNSAHQGVAR